MATQELTEFFDVVSEPDRLRAVERGLGVPAVLEPPEDAALEELRLQAIAAAESAMTPEAQNRSNADALADQLMALAARARNVETPNEFYAMLADSREVARRTEIRHYEGDPRASLMADKSEFKLGRFAPFVSAVVSRLDAQKFVPEVRRRPFDQLLREAAEATTSWVEGCRAERLALRSRVERVALVKEQVLQLLGLE